ncbi:hypothetical protein QB607_003049 [Clostridium botulinum]|nr:hypothetical protein [Clostridium botulinum]EKS4395723.1 hypothetical protein [Clostridium botulinum]
MNDKNERKLLFREITDSLNEMRKLEFIEEKIKENQQKLGAEIQKYYYIKEKDKKMMIDIDSQTIENIISNNMKELWEVFEYFINLK